MWHVMPGRPARRTQCCDPCPTGSDIGLAPLAYRGIGRLPGHNRPGGRSGLTGVRLAARSLAHGADLALAAPAALAARQCRPPVPPAWQSRRPASEPQRARPLILPHRPIPAAPRFGRRCAARHGREDPAARPLRPCARCGNPDPPSPPRPQAKTTARTFPMRRPSAMARKPRAKVLPKCREGRTGSGQTPAIAA